MFTSLTIWSYLGSYHFIPKKKIQENFFQIYLFLRWMGVRYKNIFQTREAHTSVNPHILCQCYSWCLEHILSHVSYFISLLRLDLIPGFAFLPKPSGSLDAGTELLSWLSGISLLWVWVYFLIGTYFLALGHAELGSSFWELEPSHLSCCEPNTLFRTLPLRNLEMIFSLWTLLNTLPSGSQLALSNAQLWLAGSGRCSGDTGAIFETTKKKGNCLLPKR